MNCQSFSNSPSAVQSVSQKVSLADRDLVQHQEIITHTHTHVHIHTSTHTHASNPVFVMLQLIGCAWSVQRLTVRIRFGWLIFFTNLLDISPLFSLSSFFSQPLSLTLYKTSSLFPYIFPAAFIQPLILSLQADSKQWTVPPS